ncbi:MAG: ABC transporter permease [Candidatus Aminicenantes bacterium]|nr:ABC transporter permease [Candidatus Aminicenantes bacterium]
MKKETNKPPSMAEGLLRRLRNSPENFSFLGDMEEEYSRIFKQKGNFQAKLWYWKQIFISLFPLFRNSVLWSVVMLKNYLKTALRNFKRQRGYSIITLSGLALGMACCLLIIFYVQYELSYDRFHKNAENIYRIIMDANIGSTNLKVPITNNPLSPTLVSDYPEIAASTRIRKISKVLVEYNKNRFYESCSLFADNSIFDVFNFPFSKGDSKKALVRPFTVVLTETTAKKYFGESDPLGKTLRLNADQAFEVTGVIKDVPHNSHFTFDLLGSFETLFVDRPQSRRDWISAHNFTYLRLHKNAVPSDLEGKFPAMVEKYMGSRLKALGGSIRYSLQPLTDIHLRSNLQFEFEPNSSIVYVTIFSAIALFILGLACINFMNLATARSAKRAREVGMRKVLGAERQNLVRQFLGESTIYSLLALFMSIILVRMALPLFNAVSGSDLRFGFPQLAWLFPLGIGLTLFTGMAAGSYPAFFLSAFSPVKMLNGSRFSGAGGKRFRHVLVISQFVISITLIIGTWLIRNQVIYMKNVHLGFTKERVLVSKVDYPQVIRNIDTVKARLKQIPGIIEVAGTDAVPGQGPMATTVGVVPEGFSDEEGILMKAIRADEDYLAALGMELVAGRDFSEKISTDKQGVFLVNETALRRFGWKDHAGRTIKVQGLGLRGGAVPVIGVVKDFHYSSLREEMEPICIGYGVGGLDKLVIKVQTENITGLVAQLEETWKEIDPSHPFDFFFLDSFFDAQYRSEERLNSIFASFSGLAIVIACLGLFGLSSFMAEQKTKEIGIRKVLGATIPEVVILLSKELLVLVGAAVLIAWPVAYFAMNSWLRNFPFRAGLNPWIFIVSGFAALAIAFLTVSFQAVKAASAHPADSLRYE